MAEPCLVTEADGYEYNLGIGAQIYGLLLSVTPQHMIKNNMYAAAITRSQQPHISALIHTSLPAELYMR